MGGGRRRARCKECRREDWALNAARRRSAGAKKVPGGIVKRLWREQQGTCRVCRQSLTEGFHIDHKVALARGGTHTSENLQLLCPRCNLRKGAK